MASAIDPTKPVFGNPTTQSVRDNFSAAASEITALQAAVAAAPTGDITGVAAGTGLTGGGTSGDVTLALSTPVGVGNGGTGSTTAGGALTSLGAAPLASPALTGTPTVNGAAFAAGHLPGTGTNDAAAAGQVGEFVSALVATGAPLPNSTATSVCSINLTAGDWDVSAEVRIGDGTGAALVAGAITNIAANLPVGAPALNTAIAELALVSGTESVTWMSLGPCRQSLAATTTIFLNAQQNSGTGYTVMGKLTARRMR